MTDKLNIVPGTIVIANPAQIVTVSEDQLDPVEMQCNIIEQATRRAFTYGNFNDPRKPGLPAVVEQGKYAFVLLGIADHPITPDQFFQMSAVIQEELPNIKAVGTVRQDLIPHISDDYLAAFEGELRVRLFPKEID